MAPLTCGEKGFEPESKITLGQDNLPFRPLIGQFVSPFSNLYSNLLQDKYSEFYVKRHGWLCLAAARRCLQLTTTKIT